jgi:hypothetical protein
MIRKIGILVSLLFVVNALHAQLTAPKYSNDFLSIGVGARALGMSNAQTAVVNDITAGYWNPAGLLGIDSDLQIAAMHANYFANIAQYDYAAIGKKLDSTSAISVSMVRFGVDNIPNTTELIDADGNIDYSRITSFSAADYAFLVSYARKLKVPGLTVGGSAKVIYRQVGDFAKAWGFGLDAGATWRKGPWQVGVMARDVTSTFNSWNITLDEATRQTFLLTGNELPSQSIEVTLPRLVLGGARGFRFNEKFNAIAAVDLVVTTDGKRNTLISGNPFSVDPVVGLELGYDNTVFLRGGVGNAQYITDITGNRDLTFQPNFGIGLRIRRIFIDYALTDIGDVSAALYSNVFSLKLNIVKQQQR